MSSAPVPSTRRLLIAPLLLVIASLVACSASPPEQVTAGGETTTSTSEAVTPGSAPTGSEVPTTAIEPIDSDEPFCVALDAVLAIDAASTPPSGSPVSSALTPEQIELIEGTYLPALRDLQAATPAENREPVDFVVHIATSLTLPADDPGRSQIMVDLLSGAFPDADASQAFLTYATDTCGLDEQQVAAAREQLWLSTEPEEACSPGGGGQPAIPGEDRLLAEADVTAIEAFGRYCGQLPNFGDRSPSTSGAPCGGDLPTIDLSSGPGASYGIGFEKVVEVIAEPGETAARDYLEAVKATTTTGCPALTTTGPDGSTSTYSDVEIVELPDVVDPYVAFTAHVDTEASMGTTTGIPLALDSGAVMVQHGDELLLLIVAAHDPIPADALAELTSAAVARAGW